MAYLHVLAAIAMILSLLEGHSLTASFLYCICAPIDKIFTSCGLSATAELLVFIHWFVIQCLFTSLLAKRSAGKSVSTK